MKKDAYYFPHYCNARSDRKIKRLIKQLGVEGYGIFFMVLEVLREQTDFKYPIADIDLLADEFGTSETKVRAVVTAYDLFAVGDSAFFSPKQVLYLQPYLESSQRARDAARIRWDKVKETRDANALPEHSKSIASQNASKVKESKVKEKKVKKSKGLYMSDSFDSRYENFRESVLAYRTTYKDDMLKSFFEYWVEKNAGSYKMRFEKEKTFDIARRIARWDSNNFGNKSTGATYDLTEL